MISIGRQNIKKIVMISAVVVLAVGVAGFIFRGWIRSTALTAYVRAAYEPGIRRTFDKDFTAVNSQLQQLGLVFTPSPESGCSYEGFGGFSATYGCNWSTVNKPLEPSDEYKAAWQKQSPAVEKYLLQQGWHKTWNERQPIDEILTRDDREASVGVNYEKVHGKIDCMLSIWYNGPKYAPQDQIMATEDCSRAVAFFGGSD